VVDQYLTNLGKVTRLRALRLGRGWNQLEFARRAGVSQTAVSAAEQGFSSPSLLERMGEALGVEPERLLDRVFLGPVE
jgi:transcriptional regulator with XRE-family HTH domain